jgi:hypothetical protein
VGDTEAINAGCFGGKAIHKALRSLNNTCSAGLFDCEAIRAFKGAMSVSGVRRDKAALSSGCEPHPATAPAGSNRSSHGGNEVAEAFD